MASLATGLVEFLNQISLWYRVFGVGFGILPLLVGTFSGPTTFLVSAVLGRYRLCASAIWNRCVPKPFFRYRLIGVGIGYVPLRVGTVLCTTIFWVSAIWGRYRLCASPSWNGFVPNHVCGIGYLVSVSASCLVRRGWQVPKNKHNQRKPTFFGLHALLLLGGCRLIRGPTADTSGQVLQQTGNWYRLCRGPTTDTSGPVLQEA